MTALNDKSTAIWNKKPITKNGIFVDNRSKMGEMSKKSVIFAPKIQPEIAKPYEYTEKTDVQLALVALLAAVCGYHRQLPGPPSA